MNQPKIYVAGHRGMVGSAIIRELNRQGVSDHVVTRTHAELDLTDQGAVRILEAIHILWLENQDVIKHLPVNFIDSFRKLLKRKLHPFIHEVPMR